MRTCNTWWCGEPQGRGRPRVGSVMLHVVHEHAVDDLNIWFCSTVCAGISLAQDVHRARAALLSEGVLPQQVVLTVDEAMTWINNKMGQNVLVERALTPERVISACERVEQALMGEFDCIAYMDQLVLNTAFDVLQQHALMLERRDQAMGAAFDPEEENEEELSA